MHIKIGIVGMQYVVDKLLKVIKAFPNVQSNCTNCEWWGWNVVRSWSTNVGGGGASFIRCVIASQG